MKFNLLKFGTGFRSLIAGLVLATIPLHAQFVVDNFDKNQAILTQSGSGSTGSTITGSMLGGERDIKVNVTSGSSLTVEATKGTLVYTQGAGVTGTADIVWDGTDGNFNTVTTAGISPAKDFTAGGQNAFMLGVLTNSAAASVTITVYSSAGTKTGTINIPAGITSPMYYQIAQSTFTGTGNFTGVGAVQLTINSSPGTTLVLDFLRTSNNSVNLVDAPLTDILLVDNDGNGVPSPGDTIQYVVRITNNDSTAKTGVTFNAPQPANTTLGTITASPIARTDGPSGTSTPGDSFHGSLNQTLNIPAGAGLLTNDFLGTPAATIVSFGVISYAGTSAGETAATHSAGTASSFGGNSLTVNSDGSLSLVPASTFTGLIVFQYRLSNSGGTSDGTATVAVGIRPAAVADSYTAVGNVSIAQSSANGVVYGTGADAGSSIAVTGFGPNTGSVTTAPGGSALSANGGNVTVNSDGNFSYNPPPGFTGSDSFAYKIDNGFSQPSTATVTITVNNTIWFIDNSGANGDGRLGTPFSSLANYSASSPSKDAGDIIFIYQGSGNYPGTITLVNNQQLIGQGVDLAAVTGIAVPTGSSALPGAASNPVLANAGTIVTLPGSSGVSTIRGLTLNPSSGSAISGSGSGASTVANVSINPSGTGSGITLATLNGTFTATSCVIAANSSGAALSVSGASSQTISFDSASSISQSGAGRVVNIQARSGGTVTLAGNLSATGSSTGLNVQNNTGGTITFSGGTKTLNTGANTAVTLASNTGATVTFSGGGLVIATTSGTGLTATGGGAINVSVDGGANNTINSSGATAIVANGVTFNATFFSVTSGGGANNISLTTVGGTLTMSSGALSGSTAGNDAFVVSGGTVAATYSGNITKGTTGALLNVSGGHNGTLTFNTGTLNATAGTGLQFSNADGAYNFNGTTTLNGGDAGVDILNDSAGTFTFTAGASITSPTGIAFNLDGQTFTSTATITYSGNITQANNTAMVNVKNHNTGTITFQTGTLSASNGTGLQFDNADGTYNFNGTTTLNATALSGDAGIDIVNGSGGAFTFGSGAAITNPTGVGFNMLNSDGSVSYAGTISKNNAGRAISIDNHDANNNITFSGAISSTSASGGILVQNCGNGTVTFSNGTKTLNTGANSAVTLASNTGATIDFTGGGLQINTTSGTGFNATGGGTISVQGTGNLIVATSGTGLNVSSTTVAATGLTFEKISSGAGSNVGISLINTGPNAGLTVTGLDGVDAGTAPDAGSGGTIANKTGSDGSVSSGIGIYLNNTRSISLAGMQLNDCANFAILGSTVVGFTLTDSVINGSNGSNENFDEAPVSFTELTGTASIARTTIQGAIEDTFRLVNTAGTLNRIVFDTVTFGTMSTTLGDNGLFVQARSTSTVNVTVQNSFFNSARGDQMQLDLTDTAHGDLIFQNNQVINTHPAVVVGGGGLTLSGGGSSSSSVTLTYNITGNAFRGARGSALLVLMQTGAGTASGSIVNNTFGSSGVDKSSSTEASAVEVRTAGRGAQTVSITGNTIRQYSNYGILLQMGAIDTGASTGTVGALNASVSNNTINEPSTFAFTKNGIQVNLGTTAGDNYQACVDIKNNTADASGSTDSGAGTDYALRQRQNTTLRLPGYGGANNSTASVISFIQGQNFNTETVFASASIATGGGGFIGGAACLQP